MAVVRWSPVTDLLALHNAMDRLFDDSLTRRRARGESMMSTEEGFVPIDVYRTDKEWVVRAAIPGADPNAAEVTCEGSTVRISGEIKWPEDVKSENYVLRENFYGTFRRAIELPEDATCEDSRAEFQNGMLVLRVPRDVQRTQPKRIPVAASTAGEGGSTATSERQSTSASGGQSQSASRK